MTSLELRPALDPTSAAGPMRTGGRSEPVLVGWILAGLGTSTGYAGPPDVSWRVPLAVEHPTARTVVPVTQPAGPTIGELRRLSGLTWDQLARLFGVSRRSLHFWASGKPMAPANEERLRQILRVLRRIDRGAASANRAALLGARPDGTTPFDLLVIRDDERVLSLLGPGEGRTALPPVLSQEAQAARAPRPPEALVGALQDRIHPTTGRLLAAKSIASPRRG
jgi:transcriptional regulator with XRE-family HTH domain